MRKRKRSQQLVIFLKNTTNAHPIENKKSGDDAKGMVELHRFRLFEMVSEILSE